MPPRLQLVGPAELAWASTSRALTRHQGDANGYYRAFGLHPWASRRELLDAYRQLNGTSDSRLTAMFTVLWDPASRAAYDRTPPGRVYIDAQVHDQLRRAASVQAARWTSAGHPRTAAEILNHLSAAMAAPSVRGSLDSSGADEFDDSGTDRQAAPFLFSYYRHGCTCTDTRRLARWHELLHQALHDREPVFAVGLHADPAKPAYRRPTPHGAVYLLHHHEPPSAQLIEHIVGPRL